MDRKEILSEVESDMKTLYQKLVKRSIDRVDADSLANIAGKRLKVIQLDLADDALRSGKVLPLAGKQEQLEAPK